MTEIEILIRGDEKSTLKIQGGLFTEGRDWKADRVLKQNGVSIDGRDITIEIYHNDHLIRRIDVDEKGEETVS